MPAFGSINVFNHQSERFIFAGLANYFITKEWRLNMALTKGSLLMLIIAALLSASFAAAADNTTAGIGILEVSKDLNLTTFPAVVNNAGMTGTLNNQGVLVIGSGSFIVFAPSDAAFSAMAPGDLSNLMENQTDAKRVISDHVVWNNGTLPNLTALSSVETLEGQSLMLNHTGGLKVNGASVLQMKNYDNGTVYVIDKVLMQSARTGTGMDFVEAANKMGDVKTFVADLRSAGLIDSLNGQGLFSIGALNGGPYTIFAPSDAAFANASTTVKSIASQQNGMMTLLSYHIVESSALLNRTGASSVKTLEGSSLPVDTSAGIVAGANVLRSARYSNGIIYEIDQVLIPLKLSIGVQT
jgi:uncharacterized surface protein with fasciclin (FAS1) repeats